MHGPQQPHRPVADVERAERVARRVVRHPVRERGADVLDPEHVDQVLGQLVHAREHVRGRARELVVARERGQARVRSRTMPAHDADGHTIASASPNARTNRRASGAASSW